MKSINLIPEEFLVRQAAIRHALGWGVVLAIAFTAVGSGALWQHRKLASSRSVITNGNSLAKSVEQLRARLAQLATQRTKLETNLSRVTSLLSRKYRSGLLPYIADCIEDDIVLTDMTLAAAEEAKSERAASTSKRISRRRARLNSSPRKPREEKKERPQHSGPILTLKGYTLSDIALTRFIAGLRRAEQIGNVQLLFAEQAKGSLSELKTFELLCTMEYWGAKLNSGTVEQSRD